MPKGEVKKIPIDKKIFLAVIKAKGYSIRKLCDTYTQNAEMCSDRTLRRSLNAGKIRPNYIEAIAKEINVDPKFLTGSVKKNVPKVLKDGEVNIKYYLALIEQYPYSRKEMDAHHLISIKEHLISILSLFDFSYKQFENMDFKKQYNFQHELFESMIPVLAKYFEEDGYGNKERPTLEALIYQLESYYEEECELRYADTIVRKKYIQTPPEGYTTNQIIEMSRDEILDLDMNIQREEDSISDSEDF